MSKLYASITPDWKNTSATRQAHKQVEVWAQTEYARITLEIDANGNAEVVLQPVRNYGAYGSGRILWQGNINTGEVALALREALG